MKELTTRFLLVIAICAAPLQVHADSNSAGRLKWFRNARFGMFIHWGVYSLLGRGEWVMHHEKIPVKEYEKLSQQFNPTEFDAREWVALAKAAGQKYITFTTKHHDGFCMFDSKLTDYDSMDTAAHRDFVRELVDACHEAGVRICFYYSLLDWHHPDYKADFPAYVKYAKGQLRELCTNYGKIDGIWFDGGWEHSAQEWHADELHAMIRKLQPGILINDRAGIPGDFSTPEQNVPVGPAPPDVTWESCITINRSWGYAAQDRQFKSVPELVRLLVDIVSKGGNLLLNVGPMPDGRIQPEFVERLQGVGRWLAVNGESIYGCGVGPFRNLRFGRCTARGSTLYLHVFDWPGRRLKLEGLLNKVLSARLLATGEAIRFRQTNDNVRFTVPQESPDPSDTVIAVQVEGTPEADLSVSARRDGSFVLDTTHVIIHGTTARIENRGPNVGYWTNPNDWVSWQVRVRDGGTYEVTLSYACEDGYGGAEYAVRAGDHQLRGTIEATGGWDKFVTVSLGLLELKPGKQMVKVVPVRLPHGVVMNLKEIVLTPRT